MSETTDVLQAARQCATTILQRLVVANLGALVDFRGVGRKWSKRWVFWMGSVSLLGCAASQAVSVEVPFPAGQSQLVTHANEIAWGPCPPSLPADCKMAVLEGDPRSESLFTVRFQTASAFELAPHWHPRNERVTILEGKVGVGFGDTTDREAATWFGPGDYYVNAQGAHHFVLVDVPTTLQITGIGPWKMNFVEGE
jgi:hypothetical protein